MLLSVLQNRWKEIKDKFFNLSSRFPLADRDGLDIYTLNDIYETDLLYMDNRYYHHVSIEGNGTIFRDTTKYPKGNHNLPLYSEENEDVQNDIMKGSLSPIDDDYFVGLLFFALFVMFIFIIF